MRGDTPQTLDPLGAVTARFSVVLAVILSSGVAIGMTVTSIGEIGAPVFAVAALASLAGALVTLVSASNPFRTPFRRSSHLIVVGLLAAAVVFEAIGSYGYNTLVRDDWAPIAAAIVLFPIGCFRPAREILASTIGLAAIVAVTTVAHVPSLTTRVPAPVFPVITASIVLGAGLASAAFSHSLVRSLRSWRTLARGAETPGVARDETIAEVAAERLELLDREILPFMAAVAEKGSLDARESDRARLLASSLRSILVGQVEQTWLDALPVEVDDPERYADGWTPEQRATMRAVLEHLITAGPTVAPTVRLRGQDDEARVVVVAHYDAIERPTRRDLAPFIASLRVFFPLVRVHLGSTIVRIEVELSR